MKSGKSVTSDESRSPSPFKSFDSGPLPTNLLALSALKALEGDSTEYAKLLGRQFSSPENAVVGLLMARSPQFPSELVGSVRSASASSEVSSRDTGSPFHGTFSGSRGWPEDEEPKRPRRSKHDDELGNGAIYNCDQCEKVFSKQSSLARHKYEHSGKFDFRFSRWFRRRISAQSNDPHWLS